MFSLIDIFKENEGALDKTLRFLKQNILHMKVHDDKELGEIKDELNKSFSGAELKDSNKLEHSSGNLYATKA